jgi:hypothetical protein
MPYNEDVTQLESGLGRVLEMAVEGDFEEIARKELGGAKKTFCVMSPLPGYD